MLDILHPCMLYFALNTIVNTSNSIRFGLPLAGIVSTLCSSSWICLWTCVNVQTCLGRKGVLLGTAIKPGREFGLC